MRTRTGMFVFVGASLYATAVSAQWDPAATASLGQGYGRLALSQSILSGARLLGEKPATSATPPAASTRQPTEATLTYIPDPGLSERIHTQMAQTWSQSDPAVRAQMEKAFPADTVLKLFDKFMSVYGFSSHNVADATAMLLLVSWEIATGATATPTQIHGADRQIHSVFLGSPQLLGLSNARRQEMAEHVAYQIVLGSAAKREYMRAGDQAQLAHLRELAASVLQQQGVDLRNMRLTEQGFSRSN
jgi:Family of unknown function (DUF6683)